MLRAAIRSYCRPLVLTFGTFAGAAAATHPGTAFLESVGDMFEDWGYKDITSQAGKTFVITGSNAGLGYDAAKELARKGGRVVMATRNPEKAQE